MEYDSMSAGTQSGAAMALKRVTLKEQIQSNIKHHQEEVKRNQELLKLLEKNPDLERFHNLMTNRY